MINKKSIGVVAYPVNDSARYGLSFVSVVVVSAGGFSPSAGGIVVSFVSGSN